MVKKIYDNLKKRGRFHTGNYTPKNPEKYRGTLPITYRSRWELVFMRYCDNSKNIKFWGSETNIVNYFDPVKKKMRRYFTDFTIVLVSGETQLIEIKPLRETSAPKSTKGKRKTTLLNEQNKWLTNSAKWEAAEALCKKNGWTFKILTEKDLGL